MANRTIVFLPPNCNNINQAGQGASNTVLQLPETVLYGGQQLGGPDNQPQQNEQVGAMETLRYVETKSMGVIQIMIGLVHIGFGAVSLVLLPYHTVFAALGGYPFWAGLFFIVSGSLAVSAEKYLNTSLVKCSVGMNITSSIMALVGIVLYLTELCLNSLCPCCHVTCSSALQLSYQIGTGLGILLFLFTSLEFCIAVSTTHFGCLAVCCNNERAITFMQYTIYQGGMNSAEGNPAPPASSAAISSKEEAC
ncbi:membrane-spanning 4-domains subfamily A member 12-like [Podarcis raffonei]|uniref:membrane-spanning 4-domains subfamily A member 12-like n=1 Tax=Podarcis raffonei TaxID=65483 RepID=UPI00232946DD|nr:membrane-spanning 4-domains subfamily A member 12-like [Podarcis raffonei]